MLALSASQASQARTRYIEIPYDGSNASELKCEVREAMGGQSGEESNGEIKVEMYPSMQLGGAPPQLVDQVRDGVVDIVWTVAGYTPGRFPRLEVFELPFMPAAATPHPRQFKNMSIQ